MVKQFTCTSKKPYTKHHYVIVMKNGNEVLIQDYELMKSFWYQYREEATHVEVVDK